MEKRSELIIHQALHGYSDGHTLLASSCDLSSAEKRALLMMSDLSGANLDQNFSSYLTGYPLPDNRYYALGRTWYAPEMKRPGCVWTQTLLISLPLLGRIKQLENLNLLFSRPSINSTEAYKEAIVLDELLLSVLARPYRSKEKEDDVSFLYINKYLYSKPKQPIVIPADSAISYETSVLATWSLQWPRLRRKFSFCTGALSLRRLDNGFLDCQVIPKALLRREVSASNIVDFDSEIENSPWPYMLDKTRRIELSSFMHRYGSDIIGGREKFQPLCLAFYMDSEESINSSALGEYISFFETYFPRPGEAKRLKRDLILKKINHTDQDGYSTLLALFNTSLSSILTGIDWKVTDKIISLWQERTISLSQLKELLQVIKDEHVEVDDKLLLMSELPIESWVLANWVSEELLTQLLVNKPDLIYKQEFWFSTPSDIQKVWLGAAQHVDTISWGSVMKAMIDAGNTEWLKQVLSNISPQIGVDILGELIDRGHPIVRHEPNYILSLLPEYINWLKGCIRPSYYTLGFVCNILLSKAVNLNMLPSSIVIALANFIASDIYLPGNMYLAALLLASAFNNKLVASQEVVGLLFQPFHYAGQQNFIDQASWQLIISDRAEEEVKRPSGLFAWFFDQYKPSAPTWDKCGKLRQILVESFILFKWDDLYIMRVINDARLFQQIIDYCLTFSSGVAFLIRVYQGLKSQKDSQRTFHFALISGALEYRTRIGKRK